MLWDRQRLLNEAFETMYRRVHENYSTQSLQLAQSHIQSWPDACQPLESVPLQIADLLANQFRLTQIGDAQERVTAPASELFAASAPKVTILIGEAGYGKTTSALWAFESMDRQIFYVPAATISEGVISTRDLLMECVDLDQILAGYDPSDIPTIETIARAAIGLLFRKGDTTAALFLDGLDESIFFVRRSGMQWLMNILRDVAVPVIITIRSELWDDRISDFKLAFAQTTGHGHYRNTKIRLIKLIPWGDKEILELSRRYRTILPSEEQKFRIDNFIQSIKNGRYQQIYGDIPKRPLFLRWILETVAEHGVHRVGRANLFDEWARLKIERDIGEPLKKGGRGRISIKERDEGIDADVELSFLAMTIAAGEMTTIYENELEILPFCDYNKLITSDARLQQISQASGLLLNSLLTPQSKKIPDQSLRLRFAHRAFQEFFISALYPSTPSTF